ncbi:hypothetical protein BDV95DRAFT_567555 [Massariosphaeria phaeospora]|uniref:Uncharacterized protein n=1 Tax=Massariosphaeria phaeospora TaxID=100035 RepID=A0A7C8I916_9PLEO|nr:hypothetical protein BDV95DRAFT_567555 [Massariosphaeria phaeospora]
MAPKRKNTERSSQSPKKRTRIADEDDHSSRTMSIPRHSPTSSTKSDGGRRRSPRLSTPPKPTKTADPLVARIQSAIDYCREQEDAGQPVAQTTQFTVPTSASEALTLLRGAHHSGHAEFICGAPDFECYEIGIPRQHLVAQGAVGATVHDPHWWVGKTQAEVRAGPYATAVDIRRETARDKKQGVKSNRQKEIDWKLEEGLRRQELNLAMGDDEDGEDSDGEERQAGSTDEESEDDSEDELPVVRGVRR